MNSIFNPSWNTCEPIYNISLEELQDLGIKGLILDLDGTLISKKSKLVSNNVKAWIDEAKQKFSIYILSNNPSKKRVSEVANQLGLPYTYRALKPRRKSFLSILEKLDFVPSQIAIIGYRLLTDVAVGNRLKTHTILVKSLDINGFPVENNNFYKFEKLLANILNF